jgi:hypothetical protein
MRTELTAYTAPKPLMYDNGNADFAQYPALVDKETLMLEQEFSSRSEAREFIASEVGIPAEYWLYVTPTVRIEATEA